MNRPILKGVVCTVLFAALATGCSEEWTPAGVDKGRIDLNLNFTAEPVTGSRSAASPSRAPIKTTVTKDQLALSLKSLERQFVQTWPSVNDFANPDGGFVTGRYQLEAYYGTPTDEGYGKPYYYASQELTVKNASTTEVSLHATLANSIVQVVYTDAFKRYMNSYSATVHSNGGAYFTWDESADDDLYVRPGEVTLSVGFTKPGSSEPVELEAARFTAKPRYRHTVTVDVNGGQAGKAESLSITFDDTVDQKEITLDISDAYLSVSAPKLTTSGFTSGTPLKIVEHFGLTATPKANITARGKIASVTLVTSSPSLQAKGWPAEVDLANPGAARDILAANGLRTLGVWNNPDMMGVVDFTDVLSHIGFVDGADNANSFTLLVKDTRGQLSDPVTLTVDASKLALSILGGEFFENGIATLRVHYNGPAPQSNLAFKCKNSRGTTSPLAVQSITPASEPDTYTVLVKSPEIIVGTDLQVSAIVSAAGVETPYATVKSPLMMLDESHVNSFGKSAFLSVDFTTAQSAAQSADAEIYVNGSRVNAAPVQARRRSRSVVKSVSYQLTNLAPATTYTVYAKLGTFQTPPFSFTTEPAAQIPNGNLDAEVTRIGGASNWDEYSVPGWGTNNPMTTSQGANYGYCRVSGTRATSDAHSGNAVTLQTFGWGSGNSALTGVNGAMKYADPGLLHLGASRSERPSGQNSVEGLISTDDLDCGIPFTSRPASISFWYKYTPKNGSDKGLAEVWLKDDQGQLLASAVMNLGQQATYTQVTIPFTYTAVSRKAAKLYVKFLSTSDRSFLSKNSSNFSGPGFANTSRGTYSGSTLYVDDVTLNY